MQEFSIFDNLVDWEHKLKILGDSKLPQYENVAPFVFVADEAYSLLPKLLMPYPRRGLDEDKEGYIEGYQEHEKL